MTSHSLLLAYEMLFLCSLSASNCLCHRSKYLARPEHRGPYILPFLWLRCFFTLQVHPFCLNFQITRFYPNSLGSIPGVANFLPRERLKLTPIQSYPRHSYFLRGFSWQIMQCCVLLYNEVPAFKFQVHALLEHVTELSCLNIKNTFVC